MKRGDDKRTLWVIGGLIASALVVLVAISLAIIYGYWSSSMQRADQAKQAEGDKTALILRERIDSALEFLRNAEDAIRGDAREQLRWQVEEALSGLSAQYRLLQGRMNRADLEKILLQTLEAMRWHGGRGRFFVLADDGAVRLMPPGPDTVAGAGEDADAPSSLAPRAIAEARAAGRTKGEGFLTVPTGPEDRSAQEEMAYIKVFEPLGWIVGTGISVDALRARAQRDTLKRLRAINFRNTPDEYLFVFEIPDLSATKYLGHQLLTGNTVIEEGGLIDIDFEDARGGKPFAEMLHQMRQTGDAYVHYYFKRPSSGSDEGKLAYFKYFPEWGWVVGTGLYMDNLNELYSAQVAAIGAKVRYDTAIVALGFVAMAAAAGVAMLLMLRLQRRVSERRTEAVQQILDAQASLIVLTDGATVKAANARFLDAFQVPDVAAFNHRMAACVL